MSEVNRVDGLRACLTVIGAFRKAKNSGEAFESELLVLEEEEEDDSSAGVGRRGCYVSVHREQVMNLALRLLHRMVSKVDSYRDCEQGCSCATAAGCKRCSVADLVRKSHGLPLVADLIFSRTRDVRLKASGHNEPGFPPFTPRNISNSKQKTPK